MNRVVSALSLLTDPRSRPCAPQLRRKGKYVSVHASRDFAAGDEALVSYHGRAPPTLFHNFLCYGFVPQAVSYPTLFPWDDSSGPAELQKLVEQWSEHMGAVKAGAEALGAVTDGEPPRKAIARSLLTHERRMAVEQLVALKKRLKALSESSVEVS